MASLATLFLRVQADSSRLIPEVEGASAEAGAKGAAAYQKAFQARMEGRQIYGSVKQAEAAGLRDGAAYAKKVQAGVNKAGKFTFVALVAGAVVATKLAADLQTQVTKLYTSAGESQKNLAKDMKGLLDVSVLTATSTTQLSAALYTVNSAGYHGADGLNILKVSAQAARAEQASLASVSDAVTTALKDYNLTSKDATRVANTYTAAVAHGKTTYEEFTKSLSTVQALASANKISLADLTGVLATLTDHGVSAQEATQQMAFAIRNLAAPNAVAVKEMAQLGISSTEVAQNLGKKGLSGTIKDMSDVILKNMGPSGLVLLSSMNQSAVAAKDAATAYGKLPTAAQGVAKAYASGAISFTEYRAQMRALPGPQGALLQQWKAMQDRSKGFSDQLKAGTPQAKTYTQELSKMLGGANGLQVALQLGSDGFATMNTNVAATTKAWDRGNKSVDGFAAVQKTFNFQLGAAKESLNKIAVTVGTKVIPPMTAFFKFLAAHQTTMKVLLAITAAFATMLATLFVASKVIEFAKGVKAVVSAMKLAQAATKVWAAIQWVLDAAMDANPIGLVIIAIVALIAAIVAVIVWHKQILSFFKFVWGYIWGFLKTIGAWFAGPFVNFFVQAGKDIAAPFLWLWHHVIDPAWQAIKSSVLAVGAWFAGPFVNFFVQAGKDIAAPFLWLWHHVIDPAWQGIVTIFRVGQAVVRAIFAAMAVPIGIFAKIIEIVFKSIELVLIFAARSWMALYTYGVLPAVNGIVAAAKWVWAQIWTTFIAPAIAGFKLAVSWAQWLWHQVVGAWAGIVTAAKWLWNGIWSLFIAPAIAGFKLAVSWAQWLWHQIVGAWNLLVKGISDAWNWVYKTIILWIYNEGKKLGQFFIDLFNKYIIPAWNGFKAGVAGVWNWIVKNIWNPMKNLITKDIPRWWDTGVKGIGKIWDGLKNIAKEPIKFFVNTILDDGLIAGFNWVDKALGNPVKQIAPYKLPNGFAAGGYTGNGAKYQPMGVVHGGEYVLTKEQTAAIGVNNLNAAFGKGKLPRQPGDTSQGVSFPGYADGGFVGWLKNSFKSLTDPVGSIKSKVTGLFKSIPGAGSITSMVKGAATQIVGGLGTALSKFVSGSSGAGYSGPITPNVKSAQDFIKSQNHKPYVWAGAGPGGADCSGFVSEVYNILSGKKSPWGHTFSTSNEAPFFPLSGHGIFTAGWANPGERGGGDVGHTAGNLAGLAFESGGAGGDMHFGAGSTSVDSFAHVGHMKGYAQGGSVTNDHGVVINLDGSKLTAQEQWAHMNAALARVLRTV